MNIEILIGKLLNYYQIKTLNDLAIKLDTTQSTISGWKARNAIGALTDTVANKDPEALEYIFSRNNMNFSQTGENSQQVHTQHNSGAGMIVHPNADTTNIKKEDELQPLFDALVSVSNALDKKDELREELTKLISKLPTL
ncbi:hypothetical protein [Aliarcobacter butzleri]|uniref:hypothetical protein n=1 Tax=Aliarcobacter butzleri TaxID=28197 RepID=UPI00125FE10A|nr:hypothetical protein [Aliarcobacter butzleri]